MCNSILKRIVPQIVENGPKINQSIFWTFIIIFASSCDNLIEYSPFDTDVKSHGLNIIQAKKIAGNPALNSDAVKFALSSDTHENYDDMADAIKNINAKPDLQFAVSCGDITCSGLVQEYKWYLETTGGLNYPLITVIGNHDYLANGLDIYKRLFGDPNISFVCGKYKFIVFDCAMRENYNVPKMTAPGQKSSEHHVPSGSYKSYSQ